MLRLGGDHPLTLANFQARATELVLGDLEATGSRGMIVTAGTGTGKTKGILPSDDHFTFPDSWLHEHFGPRR